MYIMWQDSKILCVYLGSASNNKIQIKAMLSLGGNREQLGERKVELHFFITYSLDGMGGHLHAPATLRAGKSP
jgi:hypothetical protein